MENLDEESMKEFYEESEEILDRISEILEGKVEEKEIVELFRLFHTLKGLCGVVGLEKSKDLLHKCEDLLEKAKSKGKLEEKEKEFLFSSISAVEKAINSMKEGKVDESEVESMLGEGISKDEKGIRETPILPFSLKIRISEEEMLPAVRMYLILEELKKKGIRVITTHPPMEEIERGEAKGRELVIAFPNDYEMKKAEDIVKKIENVKEVVESSPIKEESFEIESVRIDTKKLDKLMNLVAELIVAKSSLMRKLEEFGHRELLDAMHNCDRLLRELEEEIVSMRMIPIGQIFRKFPRIAKELARREGKKVQVHLEGMEVALDKASLQAIADPMIHLIRNSVDHGIESPEERKRWGKPETGNIWIRARREGSLVIIEVEDDGRGIDVEKVKERAIDLGVLDPEVANTLGDEELLSLIFLPGFSTSDRVSDVSGRGFGMDIVKAAVESIGGSISISTEKGKGTKVTLRLPPTLTLMRGLLVEDGGIPCIIPENLVKELSKVKYERQMEVGGRRFIRRKDLLIPILHLKPFFKLEKKEGEYLVITGCGERIGAWIVDKVYGFQEVVLKPLPELIRGTPGISGATILGDGRVALILDLCSLVSYARIRGEMR